jgi:hypothetical protein
MLTLPLRPYTTTSSFTSLAITCAQGRVLCLAHAGPYIVSGGQDGHVCVWDDESLKLVGRFPVSGGQSTVMGVHAVGMAVAATTYSNNVEYVAGNGLYLCIYEAQYFVATKRTVSCLRECPF